MGFKSVFKSLQEIFPQVDVRMLKAVAIEHSKDVDAAAEYVIFEVLPSFSDLLDGPHISSDNQDNRHPSVERVALEEHSFPLLHQEEVEKTEADAGSPLKLRSVGRGDANDTHQTTDALNVNSTCITEALADSVVTDELEQSSVNSEPDELITFEKYQVIVANVGTDQVSHVESSSLIDDNMLVTGCCSDALHAEYQDINGSETHDSNIASCSESHRDESYSGTKSLREESYLNFFPSIHEEAPDFADCGFPLEGATGATVGEWEKSVSGGSMNSATNQAIFDTEMVDIEDESSSSTMVTQSGQVCTIDILEETIRDAKNYKKTLFSTMESVINMIREVEIQEKAAEQAKEEASRGDLAILAKVEDLRQMLEHAKEANDMHAGEVYGEKAILATEMRELQCRLLHLSDERDKSLGILDEMNQTIGARLSAAEEEKKAAEKERVDKEESALKALAEQEFIMEKVVQESKKLQQEAEENAKLREFLIDRGSIVDSLQGEIAVICKDVKLLKEKFDDRVPISRSLSSTQTSCILASSSSSFKSLTSEQVPEQAESSETPKKTSPATSVGVQSQQCSPEKGFRDDGDDEWELFEDETELYN